MPGRASDRRSPSVDEHCGERPFAWRYADMLKVAKRLLLSSLRTVGANSAARASSWRRRRLLILCYHGISIADEERWNPLLYMSRSDFERRLESLERHRHTVLPLDEALQRLAADDLPDRAVVLTFDDGMHDFAVQALPVLRNAGYPVTVYLATEPVDSGLPVFPLLCAYLLWKAGDRVFDFASIDAGHETVRLNHDQNRNLVLRRVLKDARRGQLSIAQRYAYAVRLAAVLDVDVQPILDQRLLSAMSPAEVSAAATDGVDFQMHMHRHHSPNDEAEYREEVRMNRRRIEELTGRTPVHFCYPSGIHKPDFARWLAAEGVHSAVTCVSGYAMRGGSPFALPRVLDDARLTVTEFEAWTSGVAGLLPSRKPAPSVPEQLGLVRPASEVASP
jgi:peptidoglycan/xylan/chitin deacetylase (PgdA/CDA1 family)